MADIPNGWNVRLAILGFVLVALWGMDTYAASHGVTALPVSINGLVGALGALLGATALVQGHNNPPK